MFDSPLVELLTGMGGSPESSVGGSSSVDDNCAVGYMAKFRCIYKKMLKTIATCNNITKT